MQTITAYEGNANWAWKLIFLFCCAIFFTGCGDKPGVTHASAFTCATLQGHYISNLDPTETLDIAGDCTFTDSYCGYTASYTVPTSNWFTDVTVSGTNGAPGCMSSTVHLCKMEYRSSDGALAVDCDGGATTALFWRQ
jgi:hypothetical protein